MERLPDVYVLGGGSHGKVTVSTLLEAGRKVVGILDDNQLLWGNMVMDIKVLGPFDLLEDLDNFEALIAIGANSVRKTIAARFPDISWASVIHPRAYVHPAVRLGRGSMVFAGSMIQPDVMIGDHCIVNTSCSIDHDSIIGNFVHVAPGCTIANSVNIAEEVLMGIGSTVLPYMNIGKGSTVGAGGVVVKDVPEESLAIGVPARIYSRTE